MSTTGPAVYAGTWLALSTSTITVDTNVISSASVFFRITSTNGGAVFDTNSFTITVTC